MIPQSVIARYWWEECCVNAERRSTIFTPMDAFRPTNLPRECEEAVGTLRVCAPMAEDGFG
jgi:hypothetical protein